MDYAMLTARCGCKSVASRGTVWIAAAFTLSLVASAPAWPAEDLTSMSLEQLLDLKVVAAAKYEQKQSEVAAAVSVITRTEIQAFGWRTLGQALASLPGIYTTYDRQYTYLGTRGFSVSGDNNSRVLITINGNRLNDPLYDAGSISRDFPIDMDLIERIEYLPGPGGAVYGQNAMFGVINIVTRTGASVNGLDLMAAYQSPQVLREGRASWGKVYDNGVDVLLSTTDVRARGQDLFYDYGAYGISGVAAGEDGERDGQFFAQVRKGPWAFEYEHGNRIKSDPTASSYSDPLTPGEFQGDRYDLAQLRFEKDLDDGALNVVGRIFTGQYRYSSVGYYNTVPISYPATGDWAGGELRLLTNAIADHKPMLGVEYQNNYRQEQARVDLATLPQNSIFMSSIIQGGSSSQDYVTVMSGYRLGIYAQDEWHIAKTLSATLGLRWDRNENGSEALSPRVALIWQADAATTLKALYGRAHRAPNVGECCYSDGVTQVGNPALDGETVDTLELVADRRVVDDVVVRASLFQWEMSDVISLGTDPVTGLSQYQNGNSINSRGLELSSDKTWASGARLRDSITYEYTAMEGSGWMVNSPRLLGKLNLYGPLPSSPFLPPRLLLGYELSYDGRRSTLDGSALGGYVLSSLYLRYPALVAGLDVSLGIANLFDKSYAQPAALTNWQNSFEQDGRSIRLVLGYRF